MLPFMDDSVPTAATFAVALIRYSIGFVLVLAGLGKAAAGYRVVRAQIDAYRILPPRLLVPASATLPWLEFSIGVALVCGLFGSAPIVAAALLLTTFSIAVAINIIRGRRDLSCGCFGADATTPISWRLVARNGALVLALFALIPAGGGQAPWSSLPAAAALVTLVAALQFVLVIRAIRAASIVGAQRGTTPR